MVSFVLGGLTGMTLALLNFMSSTLFSSRALSGPKLTSIALALGSFVARLGLLGLLFYGLSRIRAIHFQTALVTFITCFTILLIIKTMRYLREIRSLSLKQTRT